MRGLTFLPLARSFAGLLLALSVSPFLAAAPSPGWSRLNLPETGSYALLYLPDSAADALAAGEPLPAVAFLHGAGGLPEHYRKPVAEAAESAGTAVVLPRAAGLGWGAPGDPRTIDGGLALAGLGTVLDPRRISYAGHSAGGAYAYLLAYGEGRPAAAVLSFAAPYYPVAVLAVEEPPPIRMVYGSLDPNFAGGSGRRLAAQWDRLGVAWEEVTVVGAGHNDLPPAGMAAGFAFLTAHEIPAATGCVPSDTALCLRGGRFRVEVAWDDGRGGRGDGHPVPGVASEGSGLFWFFRESNWEMLVKVLDGCPVNDRYWVFAAATTDVGYRLLVTDTETGATWESTNPPGRAAPAITATDALETCP